MLKDAETRAKQECFYALTSVAVFCINTLSFEMKRLAKMGAGLPFGSAVRAIADDIVVPALGLSKSPSEYPLSTYAYALSSH